MFLLMLNDGLEVDKWATADSGHLFHCHQCHSFGHAWTHPRSYQPVISLQTLQRQAVRAWLWN